jgi:hypothetical protein
MFITVFTRGLHWSLSWGRWIQSTSLHPICLRCSIIHVLSFYLHIGFPSCLVNSWYDCLMCKKYCPKFMILIPLSIVCHPLVRCHPCHIWPSLLPLKVTYILLFLLKLLWAKLPYTDSLHSQRQTPWLFSVAKDVHPKYPSKSEVLRNISWQNYCLRRGVVSLTTNPKAGGPPLVGCPRMLNIFAATFHMCRPPPPSEIRGRAIHGDKGPT